MAAHNDGIGTHDEHLTSDDSMKLYMHKEDSRMKRILGRMKLEAFEPTWWAKSAYPQMALFGFWQATHLLRNSFERTILVCEDGGEVAVDRFLEPRGSELPEDAPLAIFLHTITGGRYDTAEFMRYALQRGWRPFLLVRRGHLGTFLKTPKFNVMGCKDDTQLMMDHIVAQWPKARFVGAIGISAGSNHIISYISRPGGGHPVQAAVLLMEQLLMVSAKLFFLAPNRFLLRDVEGYEKTLWSSTACDFLTASYKLAGYASKEEYLATQDPIASSHENQVPCLILNAADDPLCRSENIRIDVTSRSHNFALLVTDGGSHIAYREGAWGGSSYMHRLAIDFLEASMADLASGAAGGQEVKT
ncbi:Monoacylglycerol lipase ABHD2 [Hondaea fermentalgiana]|uniref:Monoacylglycerol lipase ABHD2 n=1 Tax=Hondaea fermentalgiana TaxID=2315210 RepID=A0A2R5GHL5_9STRA|nr:Monoacylglycerol lipase ABHD2 [Hondaea fermentalgiana]|eukprot:GBG27364.1 Monoacylglycerol lipase ABHD2 [Hondaea fermentalgiana]